VRQLPLSMRWPAQQRFETYVSGENAAAVAALRDASDWMFLSGAAGSGKTHLLIAACAQASDRGRRAQYLSLQRNNEALAGDSIRTLGGSDVLALDDIDAIAGRDEAEHALFDLYNRCKMEKSTLLFSAKAAPTQIAFALPDLVSRLSACTQLILKPLGDDDRRTALRERANARGIVLNDSVVEWIFAHTARDLGSLTGVLDRLDRESLAAKRRITVPFLRTILADPPPF
jgi:DnaA-homolog protein